MGKCNSTIRLLIAHLLIASFLVAVSVIAVAVTSQKVNEYQIKAAFLYKFTSYVEWPTDVLEHTGGLVAIGLIDADEIVTDLNYLKENRAENEPDLIIKLLKPGDSMEGIHVLFVGRRESVNLKTILASVQGKPILTVTESASGLDYGSIINFLLVDERVRFEVSVTEAERSGLKISARLLGVAYKTVSRRPR